MEERLQSLSLQVDQKLETVLRALKDQQGMEEQGQSLTVQNIQAISNARVPIEVQQHNELRGLDEAAHKALSLDIKKFEKLSFDHSSRLAKMESRFDAEVSNWYAKLDDCCASLKSECQANHKLLREESTTRTHVFEELKVKLNQHGVAHMDLVASHQVLTSLLNELSVSHVEHQKKYIESRSRLESRFEADCESRLLEPGVAEQKRDVEIATLRATVQRLEESEPLERAKFEKRCAAIESLIQEHQGIWESRFHAIEPRIDTAASTLSSLREEVTAGFADLRRKIEDTESAPQRTFQNGQQQALDEAHKAQQHLPHSLKEETRLQVVGFEKIPRKMENDMSELTRKCDTLKLGSTKEFDASCSQVDHIRSIVQQTNNLSSTPEMCADLVRAVRKEREDRNVDNSEHCSEVSRVLREWQSKKSGGLSSRITNTPPGSSSENYVNTLFGKTN